MGVIASQITSLTIVYSTVYSDADQRKHQSSASLAFVRGIHRRPGNSPHTWQVTRKMFPFDDVIIQCMGMNLHYYGAMLWEWLWFCTPKASIDYGNFGIIFDVLIYVIHWHTHGHVICMSSSQIITCCTVTNPRVLQRSEFHCVSTYCHGANKPGGFSASQCPDLLMHFSVRNLFEFEFEFRNIFILSLLADTIIHTKTMNWHIIFCYGHFYSDIADNYECISKAIE